MASTRPGSRPPATPGGSRPPAPKRSRRQERIASHHPERSLKAASTGGRPGGLNSLLLFTGIAVVAAIAIIGVWVATSNKNQPLAAVQPPGVVTPASIPQNGLVLGSPTAKTTLVLYSDYQCPLCGEFARSIAPQIVQKYVEPGQVKIEWRDYAVVDQIAPTGTESRDAANAARCAGDQGKYWAMHDWLYGNQGTTEKSGAFSQDRLLEMGKQIGLADYAKFEACVKAGQHNAQVTGEPLPPADANGQTGTPTLVINGKLFSVGLPTYDALAAALDASLGTASPAPSASGSVQPAASPTAASSPSANPAPSATSS